MTTPVLKMTARKRRQPRPNAAIASVPALIVVLGMHRSGTSAITRSLQVLGVGLGGNLMPGHESGNIKGYWEDLDINALNIDMQQAIGLDWHFLTPMQDEDLQILLDKGFLLRAMTLLRSKTADCRLFGIKDPRFARLLPFWKLVFAELQWPVQYVFAVRNPLSVVQSLAKRDGLLPQKSYLLWLAHVLDILACTNMQSLVIVDYDRLMANADAELQRMADALGLAVNPLLLEEYQQEFLDNTLRHTQFSAEDLTLDLDCPEPVAEIYAFLQDKAAMAGLFAGSAESKRKFAKWNKLFHSWAYLLKLLDCQGQMLAEQHSMQVAAASQAVAFKKAMQDMDKLLKSHKKISERFLESK
jgi:hypothetical protein